ncbi:hypothetical protein [Spongorhabdus nitratireducens]
MKRTIAALFTVIFILTGSLVITLDSYPDTSIGLFLMPLKSLIFGAHMAGWMILGMISNYLWDLFKSGKTMKDIYLPDLMLPILVSPIVFFGIWSMWPDKNIVFALNLVAFQNGFFWQVILSKSGPVTTKVPNITS